MGICYSAADTPNNARYRHRRYANPLRKNNRKIKLIIGASGFGFVRSTIKKQTPLVECLSFYGEANALISELFFISSNSSLVETVTGLLPDRF